MTSRRAFLRLFGVFAAIAAIPALTHRIAPPVAGYRVYGVDYAGDIARGCRLYGECMYPDGRWRWFTSYELQQRGFLPRGSAS